MDIYGEREVERALLDWLCGAESVQRFRSLVGEASTANDIVIFPVINCQVIAVIEIVGGISRATSENTSPATSSNSLCQVSLVTLLYASRRNRS